MFDICLYAFSWFEKMVKAFALAFSFFDNKRNEKIQARRKFK